MSTSRPSIGKLPRLVRSELVDLPIVEASGLASRTRDGRTRVAVVGDSSSHLAVGSAGPSGGIGDWTVIDLRQIDGWPQTAGDSQLEAIAIDDGALVALMREDPPVVLVVDTAARSVRTRIALTAPTGSPLRGEWDDPSSRGEGLLFLRGGRMLVVKEKRPSALVEFAPAGRGARGVSRDDFLVPGESWDAPVGDADFVAVAMWRLQGPAKGTLADVSDLALGPDRWRHPRSRRGVAPPEEGHRAGRFRGARRPARVDRHGHEVDRSERNDRPPAHLNGRLPSAFMSDLDDRDERRAWFEQVLIDLHSRYGALDEGAPASYIPELATVDPDRFAIAGFTVDGQQLGVGDVDHRFTIQSISKLLLYGLALETHGRETVVERVGVAPTGDPFNSIELDDDPPRAPNPMVNAGAIAITDLVVGSTVDERVEQIRSMFARYLGRLPDVDRTVWASERATGNHNRAIAYLMLSQGIVDDRVEETLDLYFAQCSVLVTATDLAVIGATIANHGMHPVTGEQVVPREVTRDMLTVALTCGMYDYAGEWAYSVGIPAKSGVGGGILGLLPGVGGIATFSPRLDEHGNSVRGLRVFEELSREFELHLFDPDRPWRRAAPTA